jgi:RNA-directed DNA polymerase
MKRIGGLFERITYRENLAAATWKAAQGKRCRPEVVAFLANLDHELNAMRQQINDDSYEFLPYRTFQVRDTKTRTIHAPAFRDRVAHHAIIRVTGPVLESGALVHSYACRRGKGQHAALTQARNWTRRSDWYGKMDVQKFYDNIDHSILKQLLAKRFRERRLLRLFDRLLESYETSPGKGLPIGALTSQYFGNFYLDQFDRQLKATGLARRYLRYMDDVVVWGDPQSLSVIRSTANDVLGKLGLRLKDGGQWNRCERGIPFLGFVVYPDRIRLGRMGRQRLRKKFHKLESSWEKQQISEAELQARATSLFAHAAFADDLAWRQTVVSFSRCESSTGETPEPRSRDPRRVLEQLGQELPVGVSQQEQARQP